MALPPLENLLDLLPDNTQGLIEPVDLRNVTSALYEGITDAAADLTGYLPLSGNITMDIGYVPSDPLSVATKEFVEQVANIYDLVQKSGDTMDGALYLPLPDPLDYTEAAHKGYVDKSVTNYVDNFITTNTDAISLITKKSDGVVIKGIRAGQNIQLTDTGNDISIRASVEGTGGDVRTDVDNEFDLDTLQSFGSISAESISAKSISFAGTDLGDKFDEVYDSIGQESDARTAGDANLNSKITTAVNTADSAYTLAENAKNEADEANSWIADSFRTQLESASTAEQVEVLSPSGVSTVLHKRSKIGIGDGIGLNFANFTFMSGRAIFSKSFGGNSSIQINFTNRDFSTSTPAVLCSGIDTSSGNALVTCVPYDWQSSSVKINVTGTGSGSDITGISYLIMG